jgi:hypothetical protein
MVHAMNLKYALAAIGAACMTVLIIAVFLLPWT